MRRRDFITLVGGAAAAWPLAARGQQPKMPRIGIIDDAPIWDHFRRGLRELGYIEGRNIALEYRSAEGRPEQLAAAASELAGLPVDIIATYGTPASHAAKLATATIPIVMISIGDPVRAGLVASFARPGGNITGLTILSPDSSPKRLQLLKELVPSVARVAFLWNPDNASNVAQLEEVQIAAPMLGMQVLPFAVGRVDEFDGAFAAMTSGRADAFLMTGDPFHQLHIDRIVAFLTSSRLPGTFLIRENVVAGGLMSYGASQPDLFRRAATFVQKILQGAKPADLPIGQPIKFDLVINLKTARALGLTVPPTLLAIADEVIE
jgi:putative tryptophan/tyrosine transport system substrate-binding protein